MKNKKDLLFHLNSLISRYFFLFIKIEKNVYIINLVYFLIINYSKVNI
jgi:hypothetical protein